MDELKYLDKDGLIFYDQAQKQRLEKKVDKEFKTGSSSEYKVLSDNNLTDELKQKILDAGTGSFTGNYDDLSGIPTLDGTQIKGSLTKEELGIAKSYDLLQLQGDVANAMADIEEMQLYGATKEWVQEQEYQNEEEVQSLINDAIKDVTQFDYELVDNLPEKGKKGVIYLVPNQGFAKNVKDEYIWIDSLNDFEKIGTTDIDLTGYLKEDDLVPISNEEITQIVSGS